MHVTEERVDRREQRQAVLAAIVAEPDAMHANRLITKAHHDLSTLLGSALDSDAGPNFHTWAVWGSREAGRTIGRRDVRGLTIWVGMAAALVGAAFGLTVGQVVVGAVAFAAVAVALTHALLARASRHIAHGNRIVIEEIGAATIDFVDAVEHEHVPAFLASLDGHLLRQAYTAYADARAEPDPTRRAQLVFAGNCFAVKHEHIRLQHDIKRSLPWPLRRAITGRLLDFWVGDEHLHVAEDLTPVDSRPYPAVLTDLIVPEARLAVAELRGERSEGSLVGSGAPDWSVLAFRMNYVVDLFRSRHCSSEVFRPPYPDDPAPVLR